MENIMEKLRELSATCDENTMSGKGVEELERYFSSLYAQVNYFSQSDRSREDVLEVIEFGYTLLTRGLWFNTDLGVPASPNCKNLFRKIVERLAWVMEIDLKVSWSRIEDAKKNNLKVRALNACRVGPANFERRPPTKWSSEEQRQEDNEALDYARERIEEFAREVFRYAKSGECVHNPYSDPQEKRKLELYEKLCGLNADKDLIEAKP